MNFQGQKLQKDHKKDKTCAGPPEGGSKWTKWTKWTKWLRDLFPHASSQGVTAASDGKLRPLENADLGRLQGPEVSQNDPDIRTSFIFFNSTTRSYWVLSRVAVNRIRISPSTGGSTALGWGWETTWNNPWLQPWVKLSPISQAAYAKWHKMYSLILSIYLGHIMPQESRS